MSHVHSFLPSLLLLTYTLIISNLFDEIAGFSDDSNFLSESEDKRQLWVTASLPYIYRKTISHHIENGLGAVSYYSVAQHRPLVKYHKERFSDKPLEIP